MAATPADAGGIAGPLLAFRCAAARRASASPGSLVADLEAEAAEGERGGEGGTGKKPKGTVRLLAGSPTRAREPWLLTTEGKG